MNDSQQSSKLPALSKPISSHALEIFVGIVLALWVFGTIAFKQSVISSTDWAAAIKPYSFLLALTAGCLVASLACKGIDFELAGAVGLCCMLFAVLIYWRLANNAQPLVLALFLLAVKDMDLKRLLRFYAGGAIAGLVGSAVLVAVFSTSGIADCATSPLPILGAFNEPSIIACILFSVLCALTIGSGDNPRIRIALVAACLLCAAAAFTFLHAKRCAFLIITLGVYHLANWKFADSLNSVFSRKSARWFLAALPIALFCLSNDAARFLGIGAQTGAYSVAIPTYGYAIVVCFAVLYVRAILIGGNHGMRPAVAVVAILYALFFLFEAFPMHLELNGALLMLSVGLGRGALADAGASSATD